MADRAKGRAQDLVRTVVLKTNPHFPFRYTNRWPYYWALRRVTAKIRTIPEVRALYLRHGLTGTGWIPGLSDIDLSVVLDPGLPAAREFDVVAELRARYRRLEALLPMLGELEILGAGDLPTWLRATSNAPAPRAWTLLHGVPLIDPACDCSPHWRSRALRTALWIYLDMLPPCLPKPASFLRTVDIQRRVRKIASLLRPILREQNVAEPLIHPRAAVPLLVAHAAWLIEAAVSIVDRDAALSGGTGGALKFRDYVIVKVPDGQTPEEIAATAATTPWAVPIPMTQRVFRYVVRSYDPYSYDKISQNGAIAAGTNPLQGIQPPDTRAFAAYLLTRLDHVLAFTRGEELFQDAETLDIPAFKSAVRRLMSIRLIIEKGVVVERWQDAYPQWCEEFPECARALDQLKSRSAGQHPKAARQEAFVLFRSLANEMRDALAGRDF